MDASRAQAIAERIHADQLDEGGASILAHVRRVVLAAPAEARTIAWLHEALESGLVAESDLLAAGLSAGDLRALRLLSRSGDTRSDQSYLAHVDSIALAPGRTGRLARAVKIADLEDRCHHPRTRVDGWHPPYRGALERLRAAGGHPAR